MSLKSLKNDLSAVREYIDEQPLRAELFSQDQFEQYAASLAEKHSVRFKRGREKLLFRLKENEEIIVKANELLAEAENAKRKVSPAGDWLLDNYYLIEEQIRLAQRFLPKGYSRELPTLIKGPLAGYPRVYDIAMEIVSHGDGRVDLKWLTGFVSAYQSIVHLKLGELWAIPIMIRLALIENLRRVSYRMVRSQIDNDRADYWANRILDISVKDTDGIVLEIAAMAKFDLPLSDSFVAEFVRRLQGQTSALNFPLVWLEKKLSENGETIDRLIQLTSRNQAADQVSIANTIISLRFLDTVDWHEFVENLSFVENILKQDPSGDYGKMSFVTRDRYRHVIEKLSIQSGQTEEEIAASVVQAAQEAKSLKGPDDRTAHIGYYLIDKGLEKFSHGRFHTKNTRMLLFLYIGSIFIITFASAALSLFLPWKPGYLHREWLFLFSLPLLFTASQAAVSLVNWISTLLAAPEKLPKMDFSEGIPASAHTLIVVPSILSSSSAVESLIENLEVRYLANTDPNLDFALLTDFNDAVHETVPGDEQLLLQAVEGIEKLNQKYRRLKENTFYLFHRPRKWNVQEKLWMGYERKRGKLSDLNFLLRGGGTARFSTVIGDPSRLQDVKYVITIDTDTRMPRNTARDLVGIISHPLNRPVYDEKKHRITAGYGILQPRVEAGYPGDNPSPFVKVYGGESGIDPYTKEVSDVYQDLFQEGSFIGKGLYDIDAFEKSIEGRFPENLILSHDLLEGCYARSALVSDIQLYEDYPEGYLKDVQRRHRWVRGDWQIAKWLLPLVSDFGHNNVRNPLSFLSKWKILDNLRRSLVPASALLLLLSGWPAAVIILTGLPGLLMSLFEIMKKPRKASVRTAGIRFTQFCFSFVFMAYEAYFILNAIISTLWRLTVSHRRLLEWITSGEPENNSPKSPIGFYKRMFISPVAAVSLLIVSVLMFKYTGAFVFIISILWLLSPAIAYIISGTPSAIKAGLSGEQLVFLRTIARRTWGFFETFVTGQDNWLPPDNFQEKFLGAAAHRTSPTNIGLSLLSNLAAYDFGYISMGRLLDRTGKTFHTMKGMEKYRGHFYNWYDTITIKPLKPLYISSVDSGNMAGHLMVLRSGLLELPGNKILSLKIFDGLCDTLNILHENVKGRGDTFKIVNEEIEHIRDKIDSPPARLSEIYPLLNGLTADISKILSILDLQYSEKIKKWVKALEKQCYDCLEELSFYSPWVLLPPLIPGIWDKGDDEQKKRLARFREELSGLNEIPTLREAARLELKLLPLVDSILEHFILNDDESIKGNEWFAAFRASIKDAGARSSARIVLINDLAQICSEMSVMEYEFLYNRSSHLLSIGYNVAEHKPDPSFYDLLASEARLGSFVAIAQGRLPQEHWFMLGRLLSKPGGKPVLVSWGGSMFEYLMPLLVMPSYEGTLLNKTYKTMVSRQIDYAFRNNIPWGISESGYNKLDASMAYQYRAFGIPDIGFKRGLSEDLVVAPYASALALMVTPDKACTNLENLRTEGFNGEYGFYEAIDYTPSRLAHNETHAVVKSFMAHHQGMSLLALAYCLLDKPMQRRFLADPMFKATELLLQERVPKDVPFLYDIEVTGLLRKIEEREALLRVFPNPNTPVPEIHLLSNGKYSVMVTNSGGGYSSWNNIAITRWHEDTALENEGTFLYLRDMKTGEYWSSAYQPALQKSGNYEAIFSRSWAEFKRRDHHIETHTKIAVSPEDDIELRRVTITNRSRTKRIIELTSYAEVVLNYPANDYAHKSFSNLFVQTEIIRSHQAIICTRRPRSEKDAFPIMLHLMAVHGNSIEGATYETDRNKFIGRCNTPERPLAMQTREALSGSEGSVLDPIVSIRCRIELENDESATIDYITGICGSRESTRALMEKYRDRNLADRVFDLAWTNGQVELQQINTTESEAQLYGRLASAIVYSNPVWRANPAILRQNLRGQSDLWGHGISGDLPIVLVSIEHQENIDLITQMVKAHSFWSLKGLITDLVIWNEDHSVYRDSMSERINGLISAYAEAGSKHQGRIFLRRTDQMSEDDKILLQTATRIVITDKGGTLAEQIEYKAQPRIIRFPFAPGKKSRQPYGTTGEKFGERSDLEYFNGLGGFTHDGREYVITTNLSARTPAPWVNVLANRNFGTIVSESGSAYTWSENAHEYRLTPWKNDPVTDACGEALYLRDEETGFFWSPAPLPAGGKTIYVTRHGFGYSIFEHEEWGIFTELTVFVSLEHPVKFAVLKVKNNSGRKRILSAAAYYELVMGTFRDKFHMHISTEVDPKSGALLAYNPYNKDFTDRIVFLDTNETARFVCGDRIEFIGRNGTMAAPAAMLCERLSGNTGAGLDPCASMQVIFQLDDSYEKEIIFIFGSGKSVDEARGFLQRFNGAESVRRELEAVWEYWKHTLGVVYIETPDNSINFLVNGWLQYQVISCRLWGRSGFYQSGGAYGFRDQLQDCMALMHTNPGMAREQLLTFASRQFIEGDVQHWWHPSSGAGIRTHCSDDYLWLPLVTCLYVNEIGDTGVLEEQAAFLEGPPVKPGDESYFETPKRSGKSGTLYEHCVLAVKKSLNFGIHGLPLMGSGDWNDGMNLVGNKGKGESVWLAFFLYYVLKSMSVLSLNRGDASFSELCLKEADLLSQNIEENAWDGQWYIRAYFDNGEILGSSSNMECQIDSIPQSWAVISGESGAQRAKAAMDQVDRRLVDRKDGLIKLFDPPFDKSANNPGYIMGYVPGVRENGAQYTHAAVWAVIAFALLKDRNRAWELLNLINPVRHSDTPDKCDVYKVEPFVMCGDVYTALPHAGRGGWTWYTGSASWMYQLIVKYLLGIQLKVDRLSFEPCLPEEWNSFKIHYRYRETFYHITIVRAGASDNVVSVAVDGIKREDKFLPLFDDRAEHLAEVVIG